MFVNGSYVTAKPEPGDVDVVIWVGEKYQRLLEEKDDLALDLEAMFSIGEPEEAFAVYDDERWNAWVDFFSLIRNRPGEKKGLVEVKLQ
jgi:hypothetical protein